LNHLIHGDCIEHLRKMPDKSVTLLLTDPPYGMNMARRGSIGSGGRVFTPKGWDVAPPSQEYFDEMIRVSRHQVIWGGNHFSHLLPQSRCWLTWYKKDGLPRNDFADCELAWTSFDRNPMVFNSRWSGWGAMVEFGG
jgi:site-specific DNA-methyltransferase (adenine-specific)